MRLLLKRLLSRVSVVFLIISISCKTVKEPDWINNPPKDDEKYLYIVTFSEDDNYIPALVREVKNKYDYDSELLRDIFIGIFYFKKYDEVEILDTYKTETGEYNLFRINRDFFKKIFRYKNPDTTTFSIYETNGDQELLNLFGYKAYRNYLARLTELLENPTLENSQEIARLLEKIFSVLEPIKIKDIKIFDTVNLDEVFYIKELDEPTKSFNFTLENTGIYLDGFLFNVAFLQGFKNSRSIATIPIRNNGLLFVPPSPRITGEAYIESNIYLEDLAILLKKSNAQYFLWETTNKALEKLEVISSQTRVYFTYQCVGEY